MGEDRPSQEPVHHKRTMFWSPPLQIALTILIYLVAQAMAVTLVLLYPGIRGWDETQANLWLDGVMSRVLMLIFAGISIILLTRFVLKLRKLRLKDVGLKYPKISDVAYAFIGFLVYFVLYIALAVIAKILVPSLNLEQPQQIGFDTANQGAMALFVIAIGLVIIPPITEEILMRGFLYTGLRSKLSYWPSLIITSLLFAVAHLQFSSNAPLLWVAAIDTFALSVVLVYLREKTGSLTAPIVLHGIKNAIAFIFLFLVR